MRNADAVPAREPPGGSEVPDHAFCDNTHGGPGARRHRLAELGRQDEHPAVRSWWCPAQAETTRRHGSLGTRHPVITGWRVPSELQPLPRQVDLTRGHAPPGTGHYQEHGRPMFILTPELREVLEAQRRYTDQWQRARKRIIPGVFHRRGKVIRDFNRLAARVRGRPRPRPHTARPSGRTAVRNLERAGVPRSVAMKMVGHKTGGDLPPVRDCRRGDASGGGGEARRWNRQPRPGRPEHRAKVGRGSVEDRKSTFPRRSPCQQRVPDVEQQLLEWGLESFYTEFKTTGEKKNIFGEKPNGYLIFTPQKRMMALLTAEGRKQLNTDEDRIAAFWSMGAYSGIYRVEGDKWTTKAGRCLDRDVDRLGPDTVLQAGGGQVDGHFDVGRARACQATRVAAYWSGVG